MFGFSFSVYDLGFHGIDMETGAVQDLFVPPSHVRSGITPHAIIALPRPGHVELLLCYDSEFLSVIDDSALLP